MARILVLLLLCGTVIFMAISAAGYDVLEISVEYYRTAYDIKQVAFLAAIIVVLGVVWLVGLSRVWAASGASRGIALRVAALIGVILGVATVAATFVQGTFSPGLFMFGGASLWASFRTLVSLKREPNSSRAA